MSRIVIVILVYHCHKTIDLITIGSGVYKYNDNEPHALKKEQGILLEPTMNLGKTLSEKKKLYRKYGYL
jgi:hypothetical protein